MRTHWDATLDEAAERGWWHRLGTSAVLVGAGIGWTSLWVATLVAAPLSLALRHRDPGSPRDYRDDL